MKNRAALVFCTIIVFLLWACAKDYQMEAEYLKGDIGVDSVIVLKTKSIKAYNPLQDSDTDRVQVWAYTHMKMLKKGDFDSFVNAFENPNANSDATVVEYRLPGSDEKKATILFSIDDGYYKSYKSILETIETAASEQQSKIQQNK